MHAMQTRHRVVLAPELHSVTLRGFLLDYLARIQQEAEGQRPLTPASEPWVGLNFDLDGPFGELVLAIRHAEARLLNSGLVVAVPARAARAPWSGLLSAAVSAAREELGDLELFGSQLPQYPEGYSYDDLLTEGFYHSDSASESDPEDPEYLTTLRGRVVLRGGAPRRRPNRELTVRRSTRQLNPIIDQIEVHE